MHSPPGQRLRQKMPKPVDLSVLGLRPHDDLTRTRSLSTRVGISPSLALLQRYQCRTSNRTRQPRPGRACDARSSFFPSCVRLTRAREYHANSSDVNLPSQTFDRLRVLTNTLPRLILCSLTTLCRLAVTVFSPTLAQPIPSKSSRPNGLLRSGSNPHCYWAQTAQTTQQPILPPT
jgi:hypothetical protein